MKHDGNKYDQSSISSKAVCTTDMRETAQALLKGLSDENLIKQPEAIAGKTSGDIEIF